MHHEQMARYAAVVAIVTALLLGLTASPARADGDPASDVLIGGTVFVGFDDLASAPGVRELLELTAEARRKGFPIRVAVIRQATELGAIPSLFGQAQRYATFLGQELRFLYHGTLVVVMGGTPGGIGVFGPGATPAAKAAVHGMSVQVDGDAKQIASTAIRLVAAANGHALTTPRASSGRTSHTLIFVVAAAAIILALLAALGVLWRRRQPS